MSSLLDNQTLRKKISLCKSSDHSKLLHITFSVSSNHELDKNTLIEIENTINEVALQNYEDLDFVEKQNQLDKKINKQDLENKEPIIETTND